MEFAVADITDICWDELIFDQLTIPPKTKILIQALMAQHSGHETTPMFDDFVKGKGRGLNVLL